MEGDLGEAVDGHEQRKGRCAHDSLHPTQITLHRGLDSIYMTSEEKKF